MRPSRTRGERQQPVIQYLTDQEHKEALHKQADQKRNEQKFQQIQEKEQILQHYQNYNLANQPNQADQQLNDFIAGKQKNLDIEIHDAYEKYPEVLDQQTQMANNKREQDRLNRLKLRDLERQRRANGQETVYQDHLEPLPFQIERQLKENVNNQNDINQNEQNYPKRDLKEGMFTPAQINYAPVSAFRNQTPPSQSPLEIQSKQQQQFFTNQNQDFYQQIQNEDQTKEQIIERVPSSQRFEDVNQQQLKTPLSSNNIKKIEQNLERERQALYREELNQQIILKKNQALNQQRNSTSNSQHNNRNQPDDLYQQFGQQDQSIPQRQVKPNSAQVSPSTHQDNSKVLKQEISDQQRAQQQKQKYKEELDNQIQNKKSQQAQLPTRVPQQGQSYGNYPQQQQSSQPNVQNQNQQYIQNQIRAQSPLDPYNQDYEPKFREIQQVDVNDIQQNFNNTPYQQQELSDQAKLPNYARKVSITNIKDDQQIEKQKLQKQKYAEELRSQVDQRNKMKKEEKEQAKYEEKVEHGKYLKALEEEEKKTQDVPLKSKQFEVYEHKVGDKQNLQKQLNSEQALTKPQTQARIDLFNNQVLQTDENTNQSPQSYQQTNQQQNYSQAIKSEIQNNRNEQIQLQYQTPLTNLNCQSNNNYQNQYGTPQQYQQNQQFPVYQNVYDQINHFQNVLFNPNQMNGAQNFQMQVHQNYLLQLQQSKHEIEMVRQILEEKLRFQQLEMQNQLIVEQYKNKVKDIQQEQVSFEKEIQKLKAFLKNKQINEPLNPQVFSSALYMSIMHNGNNSLAGHQNFIYPTKSNHQQQQWETLNSVPNEASNQNEILYKINKIRTQEAPVENYQKSVNHLLPSHAQSNAITHQLIKNNVQIEDQELPASSDYVALLIENNSIKFQTQMKNFKNSDQQLWQNLQVQKNKSFMPELQNIKTSQLQMFSVIENIEEFQMMSSKNTQDLQDLDEMNSSQESEHLDEIANGSHINVDGFDVNMLRTQDYLDMFKKNIQSQSKHDVPKISKMLQHNSNQLENNINISKPLFQDITQYILTDNSPYAQVMLSLSSASKDLFAQTSVTNAISSLQSNLNNNQFQSHDQVDQSQQQSQLAMSSSIPLSQIQQVKEIIMSEAKFNHDHSSIVLPDDEIDEDKLNHFINSTQDHKIIKLDLKKLNLHDDQQQVNDIKNSQNLHLHTQLSQSPTSNYFSGRSNVESVVGSKKFKKPKIIDIFSKIDQTSLSQNQFKILKSPPLKQVNEETASIQKSYKSAHLRKSIEQDILINDNKEREREMVLNREQYIQTPEPYTLIKQYKQYKQFVQRSPHEEQMSNVNFPPPSNIYSNCTNLNPLNSQTTFIVNDKRAENVVNRLDNFLSQMEQSQDQTNGRPEQSSLFQSKQLITNGPKVNDRKTYSRKARELSQARKDDTVINQLDELGESQESTPHSKTKKDEYSMMMFKYEDYDAAEI